MIIYNKVSSNRKRLAHHPSTYKIPCFTEPSHFWKPKSFHGKITYNTCIKSRPSHGYFAHTYDTCFCKGACLSMLSKISYLLSEYFRKLTLEVLLVFYEKEWEQFFFLDAQVYYPFCFSFAIMDMILYETLSNIIKPKK